MAEIKNYIWVVPIIGGIFGIITFLAPVMYMNLSVEGTSIDWYYWIWGLTTYSASDPYYGSVSKTEFINNNTLLIVSIISIIMITVGVIIQFITGATNKRNINYSIPFMTMNGISAILLFIGPIIFLVGADWPTTRNTGSPPGYDVWDFFDVGFGIISPFIGGGISILAIPAHYGIFKYRIEQLGERKQVFKDKVTAIKKPISINFCPKCGQKMEFKDFKFCPMCGFKF